MYMCKGGKKNLHCYGYIFFFKSKALSCMNLWNIKNCNALTMQIIFFWRNG